MDSPEAAAAAATTNITTTTTNTTIATSSGSPPVQASPFSNYVSNLSPIKPVKAPHVAQGFLGLNSPPLVFTSPSINTLRETSFLKRLQDTQSSSGETPQYDDSSKKFADGPGDVEKSVSELCSGLITDAQHSDIRNSVQVQPSSSSGCVDEYLADPVEVDCANSAHPFNLNLKQPNDVLQSSLNSITGSEKITTKFDEKNNVGMKVNAPLALSEKADERHQGKSTSDVKPVKIEEEQRSSKWPSNECTNTESDLSVDHVSKKQQCSNLDAENAGAGQEDGCDCSPQLQHKPSQIVWAHEDCGENVEEISNGPVDNTMHDPEASQHQRGMSRRCLQFEEAQPGTTMNSTGSSKPAYNATAEFESLDSSHADLNETASKSELVNLSQPMTTMLSPCYSGKFPLPVSKPLGIGLHLNSIVNAVAVGCGATANRKLAEDYMSVQHMNSTSVMGSHSLENLMSCSELSYVDDKVSICAEDGMPEMRASIAASSAPSGSFQIMEDATPHNKRMFCSEHADNFDEFNQYSPKKKRKNSLSTNDGDGCKRCNCKKTKCLKLYCDCFAAGIYCAEPCACQGCFNRPEYEDTVLETRQQIESRNPLAFAPKIVQRVPELPANIGEDGIRLTPSSARHKRGCNCKKSMCLKKYCECYQANVGCSNGCRCEGCKNVYGRKEEYVVTEEMVSNRASEERLEGTFDDKQEIVATKNDFLHAELYESHNLTPLTPSFQFSDHGKDAPKTRFLSRRYLPSPESDLTILSSHAKSPTSPRNSDKINIVDIDGGSNSQAMEYNIVDMDRFLPRFDALADICHLTPLPNPPPVAMGSSASSKTRDQTNISLLQLGPGSGRLSSGGSLRWRSSPVTPGTKNLQGLDSDSALYDILEDDTPEMLKDASTPTKSVKVNSPNGKRVSPPHSRVHELGSISSGGLKSGRKFILQAVPSFPPLTPCIDSKGSTNQNRNDFEEKSSDK